MATDRGAERVFVGTLAVIFAASVAVTIAGSVSMAAMGALPMSGGWWLSMMWLPVCGRSWPATAAAFLGMWVAMTAAMMLPSLLPTLRRYRIAIGDGLAALIGTGYVVLWAALGSAVFPLGAALASVAIEQPALARVMPLAVGMILLAAGALQRSRWKARQLACCRAAPGHCGDLPAGALGALRQGLRLGLHCSCCCAGLTATLLATGIMDLPQMAAITAVVTLERLAPGGERIARATGALLIGAGLVVMTHSAIVR